ncbi:unnamed protein product [Adineta steineri]|uniref:Uncharacterized protein n=1 Tax=Adineta steineri TaxID=433720 RepID=A0A815K1U6_9BILA|nr:unnamed protein product [Adineta steineri]CAF4015444.1 unnamed protein product [Adineta steineri]
MTAEQESIVHGTRIIELFRSIREKNMFEMAQNGIVWWFEYYFNDHSPNEIDSNGTSLLYVACRFGQTSVAKWLLDKGAYINVQLREKRSTPLHGAVFHGHLSTVELLLTRGADINIKNQFDATVFDEVKRDDIKKLLKLYRDNLADDKILSVHLFGDGKSSGNEPLVKVQLHYDATINDLIKAIPDPLCNEYRWFSISRSPLDFDYEKMTLISAVCRARYVNTKFIDLPLCLIGYNSPRYINSGYTARNECPSLNLRTLHNAFRLSRNKRLLHITAKLHDQQKFTVKNLLFSFASNCADSNISIEINHIFSPDTEQFQLPESICIFQTTYRNEHDKLKDMPTVTISNESNIKLYTWFSNSGYWFSHSSQHNRLPRIGGIHALIRSVEIIPESLYLLPDMFIQATVGQLFQARQTPVACLYLKICDPDLQHFPHIAYHGTSINAIQSILMDGLVMPSTVVSSGFRACPPSNHIARETIAFGISDFANAIFVSPSIHYCSDSVYAVTFSYDDQRMIAVLECRVKENEFCTFPCTVKAYVPHPDDDIKAIEWRITSPAAIQITGILFIPVIKSRIEAARLRADKLEVNPNDLQ